MHGTRRVPATRQPAYAGSGADGTARPRSSTRARSDETDIVIGTSPGPVADACELVIEVLVQLGEDRVFYPS